MGGWYEPHEQCLLLVPRSVRKESNQPAVSGYLVPDRCIADVLSVGKNVSCVLLLREPGSQNPFQRLTLATAQNTKAKRSLERCCRR